MHTYHLIYDADDLITTLVPCKLCTNGGHGRSWWPCADARHVKALSWRHSYRFMSAAVTRRKLRCWRHTSVTSMTVIAVEWEWLLLGMWAVWFWVCFKLFIRYGVEFGTGECLMFLIVSVLFLIKFFSLEIKLIFQNYNFINYLWELSILQNVLRTFH